MQNTFRQFGRYAPRQGFRGIAAFLLIGFFLFSAFGTLMAVRMDAHETMQGCAFKTDDAICPMTALDHIAVWRQALQAVLSSGVALGGVLIVAWFAARIIDDRVQRRWQGIRQRLRQWHPEIALFAPLAVPFQSGIVHPKIFASANAA